MISKTKLTHVKLTRQDLDNVNMKNIIDIIHFDLPTLNLADTTVDRYFEAMISKFNEYKGYDTGIGIGNIKTAYRACLDVFCAAIAIKRQQDCAHYNGPFKHRLDKVFGNAILRQGSSLTGAMTLSYKLNGDFDSISNNSWLKEFMEPFGEVILPPNIMSFYNYYLANVFDVTAESCNDCTEILQFWPAIESNWSCNVNTSGVLTMTKSKWQTLVSTMRSALTSNVRDFILRMLGWIHPTFSLERDKYGNTLCILRDTNLMEQLNNVFPEKSKIHVLNYTSDIQQLGLSYKNQCVSYYYDFEALYIPQDAGTEVPFEDRKILKFIYQLDNINTRMIMFTNPDDINDSELSFDDHLLLALLTQTERAGGSGNYSGGVMSLMTTVNILNGDIVKTRSLARQFCWSSDLNIKMYEISGSSHTTVVKATFSNCAGLITDYNERAENHENLAIFKLGYAVPEFVSVSWTKVPDLPIDVYYPTISADTVMWYEDLAADDISYIVPRWWEGYTSMLNYYYSYTQFSAAVDAVLYRLVTTYFYTLTEAIEAVDSEFYGNQQETK